ncbi:uncharacterized protein LOC34617851 [Cyclospora cayetanensis]|uniref:Uncharacterized protein LOC34617851 n=1 Tax=Cyclospora cayetanensis TaxID=88456 RepID=A0A6P6RSJ1_9EIME|nr:uncharacterized protein LOC34617851 [Cyclospora cayetanensis]
MGANNSACLPRRAAGATARRNGAISSNRTAEAALRPTQNFKKVSITVDSQAAKSETRAQLSTPHGSPTNGVASSSGLTEECGDALHAQLSPDDQQVKVRGQLPNVSGIESSANEKQQDAHFLEEEQPREPEAEFTINQGSPKEISSLSKTEKPDEALYVQKGEGALRHQHHIHVPSHLLATRTEEAWEQHQHESQALLSPHSCSVAHRVAAALRAAAGERAAAAAARAAEAAQAAKTTQEDEAEPLRGIQLLQASTNQDPAFKMCHEQPGCTASSSAEEQVHLQQDSRGLHPQKSCFPHVSCLSSTDDSGNDVMVSSGMIWSETKSKNAISSEYSVVKTALRRVGTMFSATSAALASPPVAKTTHEEAGNCEIVSNVQRCLSAPEWHSGALAGSGIAGEQREGADMLQGALDRAMGTLTSDTFKKHVSCA